MDFIGIPSTVYVAFGVITAALLAGFFSFLNMVSTKENKVSEFRLSWVDGLRDEIAEFTAALHVLSKAEETFADLRGQTWDKTSAYDLELDWIKVSSEDFAKCVSSISKIQLRLNTKHIKDHPEGPEAKLMSVLTQARDSFNAGKYDEATDLCADIRAAASVLLKSTWDAVKDGEPGYRRIRKHAQVTIFLGFYLLITASVSVAYFAFQRSVSIKAAQIEQPKAVPTPPPQAGSTQLSEEDQKR